MALDLFKKRVPPEIPPQFDVLPKLPPLPGYVRDLTGRNFDLSPAPRLPLPPPPSPSFSSPPKFRPATEEIQEVAEAIIAEKWHSVEKELGSIKKWIDEIETTFSNLSDRMTKLEMKLDSIEQAILGKVEEYGRGIQDVGTELKAMQKVFQTVMPSFTANVKELQNLVEETKTKGFKKK